MFVFSRIRLAWMLALTGASGGGFANTVDYTIYGTSQANYYSFGGVRVTGSANVGLFNGNGLGVMGGIDFWLDGNEFLDFTFVDAPAIDVSYFVFGAGNLNPGVN